ncbi:MAG TPA: methyltransferase domain-containing protein [Gaiellaceae bacterium]|jgi:hypothetical protein
MESSHTAEALRLAQKYDELAEGFSEREYADPEGYAERRAEIVASAGPPLGRGDDVLDLCCADGVMAPPLLARGLRYRGVDASSAMVKAALDHHPGAAFQVGRCEDYVPPEPVHTTICLRSFYLLSPRIDFFRHVASYTRAKFVFDFDPRAFAPGPIVEDLQAVGFSNVELRPFFLPQRRRLPGVVKPLVFAFEHAPFAMLATRRHGCIFCIASP